MMWQVGALRFGKYVKGKRIGKGTLVSEVSVPHLPPYLCLQPGFNELRASRESWSLHRQAAAATAAVAATGTTRRELCMVTIVSATGSVCEPTYSAMYELDLCGVR